MQSGTDIIPMILYVDYSLEGLRQVAVNWLPCRIYGATDFGYHTRRLGIELLFFTLRFGL